MFTTTKYRRVLGLRHLVAATLLLFSAITIAAPADDLRQQTLIAVKNIVEPQLQKFCPEVCQLTRTDVEIREDVSEFTELGFEAIVGVAAQPRLLVQSATVNIQIDANITADNRERLRTILMNQLRAIALNTEVVWQPVEIPQIGQTRGTSYALERQLESDIEQAINKTIDAYCPDRCLLAFVGAEGAMINADQAESLPRNEVIRDTSGRSIMQIKRVNVELTLDESLDASSRERITNMVRANTRFASPVNLKVTVSQFPQSYADKLKSEGDPYGLDKLRQMLIMFRELAGTKEIITNSTSDSKTSAVNNSNSTESNKSTESQLSKSALIDSKQSYAQNGEQDWVMWGAIALAIIVAGFLAIRLSAANRDAKIMVSTAGPASSSEAAQHAHQHGSEPVRYDEQGRPVFQSPATSNQVSLSPQDVSLKLKIESLKESLMRQFMAEPRVAKETFGRMLKEDGVELTARYLQIFGHMIVLELIEDPKLSRDLYALSEFFNKSRIELSQDEELKLLQILRTKQTASEIKVLTSKGSDKFEFLDRLDPAQIFTLISEEKPQVQSIVLTQLEKKIRMSVFDMYQGSMKVRLMNELCKADAIPKEYLANVAKALHRKVDSRPEFDTENIRSSEIIIDLLERSSLEEQRQIMAHLQRTNADTARGILMKLVTLEILPYLKDGHLLEIILGMDREDLLTFLSGTQEHIRQLLMSKAPYELTEGWLEELNGMGIVDENNYKLVELKVFNKIRNLSNSGVVNILDINEMIYSPDHQISEEQVGGISTNAMVA